MKINLSLPKAISIHPEDGIQIKSPSLSECIKYGMFFFYVLP